MPPRTQARKGPPSPPLQPCTRKFNDKKIRMFPAPAAATATHTAAAGAAEHGDLMVRMEDQDLYDDAAEQTGQHDSS